MTRPDDHKPPTVLGGDRVPKKGTLKLQRDQKQMIRELAYKNPAKLLGYLRIGQIWVT
jgi:hypothetical protein